MYTLTHAQTHMCLAHPGWEKQIKAWRTPTEHMYLPTEQPALLAALVLLGESRWPLPSPAETKPRNPKC